jgi:hypothetical protein
MLVIISATPALSSNVFGSCENRTMKSFFFSFAVPTHFVNKQASYKLPEKTESNRFTVL